jgi:predicted PurR-regulated permease PerM
MTRTEAATRPTSASVRPTITTALTTEEGLRRSTEFRGGAAIGAYGTGVATEDRVIRADLDWRSVLVFLGAMVALIAFTGLVSAAGRPLTWIGVGTLLALALDPLVSKLEARIGRRSVAVGTVLVGFLVALVALVALFGPPAAKQARDLSKDLPGVVDDLGDLPIIGHQLRDADVSAKVQQFLDDLPERLNGDATPIKNAGRSVLGGTLAAIATLLAAVTLLLDGSRLLRRIRRLVPEEHREMADRMGSLAYRTVGQYFAGSVLVAAIAGVVVTAVGLILGVPLAPLLGTWVAVFDLVPQIGGAVGGIPFVVLGLTQGAGVGLACLIFFILYLQFENNLLSPLIVGKTVDLSPPATMTAALVGVSAAGVVGALVAVPLLGTAKAIYLELRPGTHEAVVGDGDGHVPKTGSGRRKRRR